MRCPRCGTENHTPEVTGHKCFNCGFLLLGEVSRRDFRKTVRRRLIVSILISLLVLGAAGYFAWTKEWFGLFRSGFVASEAPDRTPVIGAGTVPLAVGDSSGIFLREESWSVEALVIALAKFESGALGSLAPYHVLLAWGAAAQYKPNDFNVEFDDRNARVISQDVRIDITTLSDSLGVAQILATGGKLEQQVSKIGAAARVRLTGYLVSGTVNGERVLPTVPAGADGVVGSYLVDVTSIERL